MVKLLPGVLVPMMLAFVAGCAGAEPEPQAPPERMTQLCADYLKSDNPLAKRLWVRTLVTQDEGREAGDELSGGYRDAGAEIFLSARVSCSRPALEEHLACRQFGYASRSLALDPSDPLAIPGAQFAVRSRRAGYLVLVSSEDDEVAEEIRRRAGVQ